jgi:hypothetical protein
MNMNMMIDTWTKIFVSCSLPLKVTTFVTYCVLNVYFAFQHMNARFKPNWIHQMVRMHEEDCTAISSIMQLREHQGLGAESCCESRVHLFSSSPCSRICLFQVRNKIAWLRNPVTLLYHKTRMFACHFDPACITSSAQLRIALLSRLDEKRAPCSFQAGETC